MNIPSPKPSDYPEWLSEAQIGLLEHVKEAGGEGIKVSTLYRQAKSEFGVDGDEFADLHNGGLIVNRDGFFVDPDNPKPSKKGYIHGDDKHLAQRIAESGVALIGKSVTAEQCVSDSHWPALLKHLIAKQVPRAKDIRHEEAFIKALRVQIEWAVSGRR